jgi:pimeloyl-ACP methyl ester carboxylesterase
MPASPNPSLPKDETEPHRWRSPLLGELHELSLAAGALQYFERGQGPVLLFAHGWLANANLWRNVVAELSDEFRCITLDLPLGSHRVAMGPAADLSPSACGVLIAEVLTALDLANVTLVGNDSGGAYSQIATAVAPTRVGRLALNSCETPYDEFPPPPFDGLPQAAQSAETLRALFDALRDREVRASDAAYGLLIKHAVDEQASDSYALPCLHDWDILRDTAKVMSTACTAPVHSAGAQLIAEFKRPVLFAWSPEDRVFPIEHAQRYAGNLQRGEVVLIENAYSFTPEDQPVALAHALARFAHS